MVRHVTAIVAGVGFGWIAVEVISYLGVLLFPAAVVAGSETASYLGWMIGDLPINGLLVQQLAWFVGAGVSAWLASRIHVSDKLICGALAALLLLALSVITLILNPSPLWFILLTPLVFLGGAAVGLLPQWRAAQLR